MLDREDDDVTDGWLMAPFWLLYLLLVAVIICPAWRVWDAISDTINRKR